jgi:integrase
MGTKALTQATCEKARPKAERYEIPDGLLVGLRLTVQPSGGKSWCARTRVAGRPVKITLGSFPAVSLRDARGLGREALMKAKIGISVTTEKRDRQRAAETAVGNTFKAIAEEYLRWEGGKLRTMDQRHGVLDRSVYPVLGSMPIEAVRRVDVVRMLDKTADERGTRAADMALAVVRRICNWHSARSDFRSPIVRSMARHEAKPRARILTDDELRAVWTAAGDAGTFGLLVRFLLLTGARRNEASQMQWREIAGTDWTLPASRNKGKVDLIRPLSSAALGLLVGVPRFEACDFTFTVTGAGAIRDLSKPKTRLDEASGVSGWRLHDLRRTARSLLSRAGVPSDHGERCLGHVIGGVRGVYDRYQFHSEKKHAFGALAALIERIVNPVDNVSALRR